MCVCAATRLAKIYEGDCPTDGHAPISLHCYFVKEKKKYFKKIKLNFENWGDPQGRESSPEWKCRVRGGKRCQLFHRVTKSVHHSLRTKRFWEKKSKTTRRFCSLAHYPWTVPRFLPFRTVCACVLHSHVGRKLKRRGGKENEREERGREEEEEGMWTVSDWTRREQMVLWLSSLFSFSLSPLLFVSSAAAYVFKTLCSALLLVL